MSTFVLLHGGGMGGWTWKYVRALLEAKGHMSSNMKTFMM